MRTQLAPKFVFLGLLVFAGCNGSDSTSTAGSTVAAPAPSAAPTSELSVSTFQWTYLGRKTTVDTGMGVTLIRNYQIQIPVEQMLEDDTTRALKNRTRLRVRLTLLKGASVIAHGSSEGSVVQGALNVKVSLPVSFRELPIIQVRQRLLVEIDGKTIDARPVSYTGITSAVLFEGSGASVLEPSELLSDKLISDQRASRPDLVWTKFEDGARFQDGSPSLPADRYAEYFSLISIPRDRLRAYELSAAQIQQGLYGLAQKEIQSATLSKFCMILMSSRIDQHGILSDTSERTRCEDDPRDQLVVNSLEFVDKIMGVPTYERAAESELSVSASYSVSSSENWSISRGTTDSASVQASVSTKAGFNLFGNGVDVSVSASGGRTWFKTYSESKSYVRSNGLSVGRATALKVQELSLSIPVQTRQCVVVSRKDQRETKSGKRGAFVCFGARSIDTSETWYSIYDSNTGVSGALRDGSEASHYPFNRVVRSSVAFEALSSWLLDSERHLVFVPTKLVTSGNRIAEESYAQYGADTPFLSDGVFPGVLVRP